MTSASTSGATTNGTLRYGFDTSGNPNINGSFALKIAGTSVASATRRVLRTLLRSSNKTSGNVAPAPPGKTKRNVATVTTCGSGSPRASASVFCACN